MKKILYLSFGDFSDNSSDGISKKIRSQLKSFENLGFATDYTYVKDGNVYLQQDKHDHYLFKSTGVPYRDNMLLYKKILAYTADESQQEMIVYIRNHRRNLPQLRFLKQMVNKQKSKVLLEIPTYPYKGEKRKGLRGLKAKVGEYQDDVLNLFAKKYIDKIVTFSKDETILGRPCICISNGIDLETTQMITKANTDTLTFTSVSICKSWHGIDRFLQALEKFQIENPMQKVKFNIIGEGTNTAKLKEIVTASQQLSKSVIFHGFKSGNELDEIYNQTDIAVGSLGIHRIGLTEVQPLKNREYAAKGLPFIISFNDPDFTGKEFVFQVTNDEQVFDLQEIIEWYQSQTFNPQKIHEYAKKFSWDTQMKKVIQEVI